jgi:hypothetical protein
MERREWRLRAMSARPDVEAMAEYFRAERSKMERREAERAFAAKNEQENS